MQDRLVYRFSPAKLLLLGLGGMAMAALSAAVGFDVIAVPTDPVTSLVCKLGTVFFGLCAVVAVVRLLKAGTDAVILTATGVTDSRLAAGEIAWTSIADIETCEILMSRFIVFDIDPAAEKELLLNRKVRAMRAANRRLGIQGLAASASELNVDTDTLLHECLSR